MTTYICKCLTPVRGLLLGSLDGHIGLGDPVGSPVNVSCEFVQHSLLGLHLFAPDLHDLIVQGLHLASDA